jgi:hypothetical protein
MDEWLRKAADLAAAQDGVIGVAQLLDLDVSTKTVRTCVERGWLCRELRVADHFVRAHARRLLNRVVGVPVEREPR